MAGFNQRVSYPVMNYGGGYSRNDYQNNSGPRDGSAMMRNFNENAHAPFQRFPAPMGLYHGRPQFPVNNDQFRTQSGYRARPPMPPNNNRMTPSGMLFQQPFSGSEYYRNAAPPQIRPPMSSNERFFVSWNQRPQMYYGPRMPMSQNNVRKSTPIQKPVLKTNDTRPKKKKNKKKKYTPRPREDAKKLKPWMTDEIYEEVKKKNELYVRAKNEDKPELWQEFKLLRNRVGSMIKEAKLKGGFLIKKLKEDEDAEKPFSCDTCDRAYALESDMDAHLKEHVKCESEGCSFESHPKIMELHKKMLHETGYADAILKLNNSEEVVKWRNERRSHYPTAENIKKRQAKLEEKIARGEVLETEQFGKFKKQRYGHSSNSRFTRQRGRFRNSRGRERRTMNQHTRDNFSNPQFNLALLYIDSDSDNDSHIRLPPFAGIVAIEKQLELTRDLANKIIDGSSSQSTESQTVCDSDNGQNETPNLPLVANNNSIECSLHLQKNHSPAKNGQMSELESLMPNGTACESDDEGPTVQPILNYPTNQHPIIDKGNVCNYKMQYKENQSEVSKQHTERTCNDRRSTIENRHEQNKPTSWNSLPAGLKKHNLLDKLLANEIRHERNVILQCVRYIVKNNFFEPQK